MTEERKTLADIREAVNSGQELASDKDLQLLFQPEEPVQQQETPPTEPVQSAPVETPPVLNAPPIPVQEKEEMQKVLKTLDELRMITSTQDQELRRLRAEAVERNKPPVTTSPEEPEDENKFFEKPYEEVKRIARQIATEQSVEAVKRYDSFQNKKTSVATFKQSHPDFDQYRQAMLEVIRENPHMDNDVSYLPTVYTMAKERVNRSLEAVRGSLGLDPEKLKREAIEAAKREIYDELTKRKSAAGVTTGTGGPAVLPTERPGSSNQISPEDSLWNDIVKSGPKSYNFI
jgi:hypothetical protein